MKAILFLLVSTASFAQITPGPMPTLDQIGGMAKSANLSDLGNVATAKANLGIPGLSITGNNVTVNGKPFGTYPLSASLSGTGNQTTFTVAHSLGFTPSFVAVHPNSNDAANIRYYTVDATNVTIYYTTAPVPGSNNLIYSIELR
ncbi:hypothetical protein [Spirosoma agri]|uniref:Uncharacterized protein n=1 Tax=Spirosoma agri TaxID=1987381 RepID=A0A6M0IKW5_9BACT|nr:hypothetical protein [Spirosoma agri]NEU68295.1 hypothetical protein [Spirosoma agri]